MSTEAAKVLICGLVNDPTEPGKVKLMDGERIVFTEESNPQQYVKLVASGDVDATLLDAIENYVKRQKKRLGIKDDKAAN